MTVLHVTGSTASACVRIIGGCTATASSSGPRDANDWRGSERRGVRESVAVTPGESRVIRRNRPRPSSGGCAPGCHNCDHEHRHRSGRGPYQDFPKRRVGRHARGLRRLWQAAIRRRGPGGARSDRRDSAQWIGPGIAEDITEDPDYDPDWPEWGQENVEYILYRVLDDTTRQDFIRYARDLPAWARDIAARLAALPPRP